MLESFSAVPARMSDEVRRTNNEVRCLWVAAEQCFSAAVPDISEYENAVEAEGHGNTSKRAASLSSITGKSSSKKWRSGDE